MPRSKLGVKRPLACQEVIEKAIAEVEKGSSLREAAAIFNITKSTLQRHINAKKNNPENCTYGLNVGHKEIFTEEEENDLELYLKRAAKLHYGLTKIQFRQLAYQFAHENDKNVPHWEQKKLATSSWIRDFQKRHPILSLKKPEATNLARSTAFNKHTVTEFYHNLVKLQGKYNFPPHRIWNADESGCSTVHNPPKIFAEKGCKQVGSMTSGERGETVTIIAAINAIGNCIPPLFVFPRKFFKDHMLKNAPIGSIGVANPSGWSNEKIFLTFLEHFIIIAKPSLEEPHLLILDNHCSHISVPVIQKSKDSGIILLTIPPHTSHKLQPLDRTVFGPFKSIYNQAMHDWMASPHNAGKTISIYDVSELAGTAYPKAFSARNITSGFKASGIVPLNCDIFTEDEFLTSFVTDRPPMVQSSEESQQQTATSSKQQDPHPIDNSATDCVGLPYKSPELFMPFPKAQPRKTSNRLRVKSRILTDTPEKEQIERQKQPKRMAPSITKHVKKILVETSSDSEDEIVPSSEDDNPSDDSSIEGDMETLEEGAFVLARCSSGGQKKIYKFFVAVIKTISDDSNEMTVMFLKKMTKTDNFILNEEATTFSIDKSDVIRKLPLPKPIGGTLRSKKQLSFGMDFSSFNMG